MSLKITIKDGQGFSVYEVLDNPQFYDQAVRRGPEHIGSMLDCMRSPNLDHRFIVAAALHHHWGGHIEHWCELCRCKPKELELGIWK